MAERKNDLLIVTALLAGLILFFSKILFTHQIIRAPDIINEFYWGVKGIGDLKLWELFRINLSSAGWDIYVNSGSTNEGGAASMQFLFLRNFIFWIFPSPASVGWYIVVHFFIGAAGTYYYCRLIGTSRLAALLGALIFALSTENASLINAGHVMKIATISFAPWAFYFIEKGFKTRRLIFFLSTSVVLAYQFFHTHWQIAYYTCLAMGVYGLIRCVGIIMYEQREGKNNVFRLVGLNLVTMFFFLSTVAISLVPLANWAKGTNRDVGGASSTTLSSGGESKGGMDREEAMSWSLPPEELAAFVIPGFFGFSRQEAGPNPSNIPSYYWGRMVFTQTLSYMGLLPWLLIPLPLFFRRDKYTWLAVIGLAGGVFFSMGKFTPFYNFLYDYFPGINRFRVPKMMMFIPVLALGVLSARGVDLLMNHEIRAGRAFRRYLVAVAAVPLLLLLLLGVLQIGKTTWIQMFYETLAQPTRYEQGMQLIPQRWNNLMLETAIAAVLAALCAGAIALSGRLKARAWLLPCVLIALYVADMWRVNNKFMFLVDSPVKSRSIRTPVMDFLAKGSNQYRSLPMDGSDPMHFASNGIPVLFTSNPVQQQRWQNFIENFGLDSALPDILNVKYLIYSSEQYAKDKPQLSGKYVPVFQSPDGLQLVLENRMVMPKAWLVTSVLPVGYPLQALEVMQNPLFNPRQLAMVESPPPLQMAQLGAVSSAVGSVLVKRYEGEQINLSVSTAANSLLVMGEKYYRGWKATVDGKPADIQQVNYLLRGVYLGPGSHSVEFRFDPLPFKIGKYLTLASFAFFAGMLIREYLLRRKGVKGVAN